MGETKKLLTIVVPAYNVEKYVGECLNSLVKQTLNNHKVIIVDDGSKDEHTSEICKSYAEKYPDIITYVHQENKGLGAARNTGLDMVDTEYVGFLDSDDWLVPNYVERVSEELEDFKSEKIDLVFTLPTMFDSLTNITNDWYDKETFIEIFYSNNRIVSAFEDKRLYYLEPNACRRIYRMDFLKKYNFSFPEGVKWEDIYPHFYLLYFAKKCIGIKDVGFNYRINTAGQITAQSGKGRLDIVPVFFSVFNFAKKEKCDWLVLKAMIYMLNKYSKWSLEMSDITTRPMLVQELSQIYCSLPESYFKRYFKERKQYKKERTFVWVIRRKHFRFLLNDYLPAAAAMNMVNRLRRFL